MVSQILLNLILKSKIFVLFGAHMTQFRAQPDNPKWTKANRTNLSISSAQNHHKSLSTQAAAPCVTSQASVPCVTSQASVPCVTSQASVPCVTSLSSSHNELALINNMVDGMDLTD